MSNKMFRNRSAMIVTIVTIILIIIIGFTSRQREEIISIESWTGSVVNPIQRVLNTGGNILAEGVSSIFNFSNIKRENLTLKEEITTLEEQLVRTQLSRDELEELRGLRHALNYIEEEENFNPITANIVGKSPSNWFDVFTIDVGQNQGVKKDSVVLISNGLVGRVYEVGENWSKVISIIDNNSSVSFQILRDRSFQGILSGSVTNELSGYLFDPMAEVVVGDRLITSGLGMYPQGIIIGEVVEVAMSTDQLLKTVRVEPYVNFRRLNKVLVMAPQTIRDE